MYGFHGVFPQEQKVGAEYRLWVTAEAREFSGAADSGFARSSAPAGVSGTVSDELADTVSYADIYEVVKLEFGRPAKLIEHLACRIASHLLDSFPPLQNVDVKIVKVAPPIPGFAGSASVRYFWKNKC